VIDNLENRWIGIKLVTYDLAGDDVKLELWVDDGNQQNIWKKVTEYVDDGDWEVSASDCDRSDDDIIEEGTRGGFRVDDSEFEFKNLSIREIKAGQAGGIIAVNQEEVSKCLFTYTCNVQGQMLAAVAADEEEEEEEDE
jgi:hypothetical protein